MNIMFNETITFPSLTFCMSRKQAWSHFDLGNTTTDNTSEWDDIIKVK